MKIILKTTLFLFLLLFLIACKKEVTSAVSQDPLTNLTLTDAAITSFFKNHSENDSIQKNVALFYKNRNNTYAWFNKSGMSEAVLNFQNQWQNYTLDFADKSLDTAELDGLINTKTDTETNPRQREYTELLLTTTYFKYAKKAFGGISKTARELDWYIPRAKRNYQTMLDSLVTGDKNQAQQPLNPYYAKLLVKLHDYREIQKNGGFPFIKTNRKVLAINDQDSCIIQLKQRLLLSGDLTSIDLSTSYTKATATAVSTFQQRLGLTHNGVVDSKTLAELNKSIDSRIKQIMINLERLRWGPTNMEKDYLIVNIPEYKLHVIQNSKLRWETNVVVGKTAKQTSIFRGNISRIILNPYWNVPNSIINEEILPKLKQNSNYLSRNNMEVVSGDKVVEASQIDWHKYTKNIPFTIRQKPSADNALGKMKFLFPNNFNIYLHDTPAKELFNHSRRDFSHGCIRVENPKKLALYLLRKNTSWNEEKIAQTLKTNTETGIAIKPNMPVYIVYFTAWVDSNNNLNFRNDLYNLDEKLAQDLFATP